MYNVTDEALTRNFWGKAEDPNNIFGTADDPGYTVFSALSESLSSDFEQYLEQAGLIIHRHGGDHSLWGLQWENNGICDVLRAIATLVRMEYDSEADVIWNTFKLSGDDDVDYFGGYLCAVADALECWMKHNEPN